MKTQNIEMTTERYDLSDSGSRERNLAPAEGPQGRASGNERVHNKTTRQTELPLNTAGKGIHSFPRPGARGAATGTHRRQPTRIERAAWWFGRMRQTVDNAAAWSAQPARP